MSIKSFFSGDLTMPYGNERLGISDVLPGFAWSKKDSPLPPDFHWVQYFFIKDDHLFMVGAGSAVSEWEKGGKSKVESILNDLKLFPGVTSSPTPQSLGALKSSHSCGRLVYNASEQPWVPARTVQVN